MNPNEGAAAILEHLSKVKFTTIFEAVHQVIIQRKNVVGMDFCCLTLLKPSSKSIGIIMHARLLHQLP